MKNLENKSRFNSPIVLIEDDNGNKTIAEGRVKWIVMGEFQTPVGKRPLLDEIIEPIRELPIGKRKINQASKPAEAPLYIDFDETENDIDTRLTLYKYTGHKGLFNMDPGHKLGKSKQ